VWEWAVVQLLAQAFLQALALANQHPVAAPESDDRSGADLVSRVPDKQQKKLRTAKVNARHF
jgi:hypothetical protein